MACKNKVDLDDAIKAFSESIDKEKIEMKENNLVEVARAQLNEISKKESLILQ